MRMHIYVHVDHDGTFVLNHKGHAQCRVWMHIYITTPAMRMPHRSGSCGMRNVACGRGGGGLPSVELPTPSLAQRPAIFKI